MSQDDFRIWFIIAFAAAMSVALIVRTFRGTRAPARRNDAEMAAHRASGPPRRQHYAFAHQVLRDYVLADPRAAFDALSDPGALDRLVSLWNRGGKNDAEDAERVSPVGLRIDIEGDVAIITLPPPARVAEAYMIAVAREPGAYFVLERGERTAHVAEWRRDMRVRLPNVRQPSKAELLAVVRAELSARAADLLVCCPYCISPLDADADAGDCPTCARDTTRDAKLEYTRGSYASAPRMECAACGREVLTIAVTCPACRARPGGG